MGKLVLFFFIFALSCSTLSEKKSIIFRTIQELEKAAYHKVTPILEESAILNKIERFESILKRNKTLSSDDWKLHDQLLDTYIYFKERNLKQNKIIIPPHTKIELPFESFCLDPARAPPARNEVYQWVKKAPKIPYYPEILNFRSKKKISQEEAQELFWNLRNKTFWENYPKKLQKTLLLLDPHASKKLPSKVKEKMKKAALEILYHTDLGQGIDQMRDLLDLVKGKYYSYQSLRESMERLTSSYPLDSQDKMEQMNGTKLYATHKSYGISSQSITFYNPKNTPQEIGLSQYQLHPLRKDIQRMGLLPKMIKPKTLQKLEKVLFKDMLKIGIGFTPFVGDITDLYEFLVGRDFVTGTLLSKDERLLAGVGIIFGSGSVYRYTKRVIHSPVSHIDNFSKELSKRTKKATNLSKTSLDQAKGDLIESSRIVNFVKKLRLKAKHQIKDLIDWSGKNFKSFLRDEGGHLGPLIGKYKPAPKKLKAFKDAIRTKKKTKSSGGGLRPRWKDKKGKIYEWDGQHGRVEKYNKKGKHLGEFDAETGEMTKPANPKRTVEP